MFAFEWMYIFFVLKVLGIQILKERTDQNMKKQLRITALLLALTMLLALFACAPAQSDDTPTKTAAPAKTDAPADKPADEPADEPVADEPYGPRPYDEPVALKIPVYDRTLPGLDVTDNYWTHWVHDQMKEAYNIETEHIAIPRSDEVNRFIQLIAVQEAPDIIYHYEMPYAMTYQSMGALQPIDEAMMEEYMPDYLDFATDVSLTYGYVDGVRWFIPAQSGNNDRPAYGAYVRADWMEEVGIEKLPENLEEFNAMLIAFRDAQLGGAHTVPFARAFPNATNCSVESSNFFMGDEYTLYENALYMDINIASLTWGPSREWLGWLNYLYNEGLISSEIALEQTQDIPRSYFLTGEAGAVDPASIFISTSNTYYPTLKENCPEAVLDGVSIKALAPEGNPAYTFVNDPHGVLNGINVFTEHPEAAMMYINWLCKEDVRLYMHYGEEGKQHQVIDGYYVRVAGYEGEDKLINGTNGDMWICSTANTVANDDNQKYNIMYTTHEELLPLAERGWQWLLEGRSTTWCDFPWIRAIEAMNTNNTVLNDKWLQLATQIIICAPEDFDAVYEAACQEYLDAGYADVLAEKEARFFEMYPDYSDATDIHDVIK